MLRAVQFNSREVRFHSLAGTIRFSSDKMLVPGSTMGGPIVSLRLAERGDGLTVASNESDRGGDSVCSATDALIVADDRRDEGALRRSVVHDRAFALSSHPIRAVRSVVRCVGSPHRAGRFVRRGCRSPRQRRRFRLTAMSDQRNGRSLRPIARLLRLIRGGDQLRATACRHGAAARSSQHIARSSGHARRSSFNVVRPSLSRDSLVRSR